MKRLLLIPAFIGIGAAIRHAFGRASNNVADEFGQDDHTLPTGFFKVFHNETDPAPFDPLRAAGAPAADLPESRSGGLVEQDGFVTIHPPFPTFVTVPPEWITAANADEDRFNQAVNRRLTSLHSAPIKPGKE